MVCAEEHPDSFLHVFVCIKHCKADRIVPLCTYFLHRMPRSSGLSLLPIREIPFSEHGPAILTKGFRVLSQFHEDITGIVPHIWPQLLPFISFPNYFSLFILTSYVVSRAAARIDASTVIWVSVSLDCSLTSFDICETSVRFIGYFESCKVWPIENINARMYRSADPVYLCGSFLW